MSGAIPLLPLCLHSVDRDNLLIFACMHPVTIHFNENRKFKIIPCFDMIHFVTYYSDIFIVNNEILSLFDFILPL